MKNYNRSSITIIALTIISIFASIVHSSEVNTKKVAIVFNGKTETNNKVSKFVSNQLKDAGYSTVAIDVGSNIDATEYKAIVILNTGISSGIDKTLLDYIVKDQNKEKIFLANLYTNRSDLKVVGKDENHTKLGVDGISAASSWKGKGVLSLFGGGNSAEFDSHMTWNKILIDFLNKLK